VRAPLRAGTRYIVLQFFRLSEHRLESALPVVSSRLKAGILGFWASCLVAATFYLPDLRRRQASSLLENPRN
jgi:hypothetical protein